MSAFGEQVSRHSLTHQEITATLKGLFSAWAASETASPVEPISEYIGYAVSHIAGSPKHTYDKLADECVYIVDLDGGTWGVGEAYDPAYRHGDVFEEPPAQCWCHPAVNAPSARQKSGWVLTASAARILGAAGLLRRRRDARAAAAVGRGRMSSQRSD